MDYVVDFQGFQRIPNQFIFKELAIMALEESVPQVFTFKPPISWYILNDEEKCTARWLIKNHHGIPWGYGIVPYAKISNVVRTTKRQKKSWLEIILPEKK